MEKDNEINGSGNAYDFGARIYDSRLGKWMSLDRAESYFFSKYVFVNDNPIQYFDFMGLIKRDPRTHQIIFTPKTGNINTSKEVKEYLNNGQAFVHASYIKGYIETDKGNKIEVYLVYGIWQQAEFDYYSEDDGDRQTIKYNAFIPISRPSQYSSNCYGNVIADDMYFIPSRESIVTVLKDEYKIIKQSGEPIKDIEFKKGDIMEVGIDHFIKATGNYNKKGEMIWSSHFSMDEKMEGSLTDVLQYLRNSGEGQEEENLQSESFKLFRPIEEK